MSAWNSIKSHPERSLKTLYLYLCFLSLGAISNVVGPCLLDLKQQVGTDLPTISFCVMARAIGHAIGCLCSELFINQMSTRLIFLLNSGTRVPQVESTVSHRWLHSLVCSHDDVRTTRHRSLDDPYNLPVESTGTGWH